MRIVLFVFVLSTALCAAPHPESYPKLVDEIFDSEFKRDPTFATMSGIHRYDGKMQDFSKQARAARIAELKKFLARLDAVSPSALKRSDALDRELLQNHVRAELLELEDVRMWQTNPDLYSSAISQAVFFLIARDFDTLEARLRAVIGRQKESLVVLAHARENLANPPKIHTEVALDQLPGMISFFEKDVPLAFASVKGSPLKEEFKASNAALVEALKGYQTFLKEGVLPASKGDFRLGAERYRKKLQYEEMVDTPLDQLLEIGLADLKKNQAAYAETARKYRPGKTPKEVLAEVEKDYPPPSQLLATIRKQVVELKNFMREKQIVTIPSEILPKVEETPAFMRALLFASMETPGPYEKKAKEAYYHVTLPEPGLSQQELDEYMAIFSYPVSMATSIHEAYPGHYTQFLWVPKAPSKVRKLIGTNTNVEGWAHYTEQMVLDEGFANGDHKMRLGQLQEALLRNARFIVGIKLHTGQMTFDEAVEYFQKEGFQSRAVGVKESTRAASDPTYLYYTLGKLQILKLRKDYQAKMGARYRLKDFHDTFLSRGFPPIQIIREEMLGEVGQIL